MRFLALLLAIVLPSIAFASPPSTEPQDKYLTRCTPTAKVKPEERLPSRERIVPSGKLAIPAGKSMYAPGQPVFLSGKVLDENCVPISDAIVELWQADATGKYRKTTMGQRVNPYPVFVSTGRAVTDNLGRYNFVTIFPGIAKEEAPHVHIRISRKNFKTFETELYFAGDARNESEKRFAELSEEQKRTLTATVWPRDDNDPEKGLYARWDVTLKGKNRYRHY